MDVRVIGCSGEGWGRWVWKGAGWRNVGCGGLEKVVGVYEGSLRGGNKGRGDRSVNVDCSTS